MFGERNVSFKEQRTSLSLNACTCTCKACCSLCKKTDSEYARKIKFSLPKLNNPWTASRNAEGHIWVRVSWCKFFLYSVSCMYENQPLWGLFVDGDLFCYSCGLKQLSHTHFKIVLTKDVCAIHRGFLSCLYLHKWEEIVHRGLCKATVTWQQIIYE